MKIETVNAGRFHMDFFRFGHGKEALVILPGLSVQSVMLSADAIEKAYRPLANDFTVFVFDRRRELPLGDYSIDDMANDTAETMVAAGIGQASIFGASQGAMMAMKIAARCPQLVKKLVLASAAERITDANRAIFENWIALAKAKDAKKLYLCFGEMIYPQSVFENLRALLIDAAKSVSEDDLCRFVILTGATKGFDATRELERIPCPTLVVGDTDDRVFGEGAARAIFYRLKNTPSAELYLYNGYGHALYDTAPDFKERMLRFLVQENGV